MFERYLPRYVNYFKRISTKRYERIRDRSENVIFQSPVGKINGSIVSWSRKTQNEFLSLQHQLSRFFHLSLVYETNHTKVNFLSWSFVNVVREHVVLILFYIV